MVTRVFQPNLTGGILGDAMYARTDTSKYAAGVKDAVNMLIIPQGGMENRAGFQLASGYDTSGSSTTQWLIPFSLTNQTTAILELTESVARVIFDGAYVIDSSFTAKTVSSVQYVSPGTITMASGADAATYSVGDLVYLSDPNGDLAIGEQVLRVSAISTAVITFQVYDGTTLDMTSGSAVWGTLGSGATLQKVYSFAHPWAGDDLAFLRYAQDNLDMYLVNANEDVQKLTYAALDSWTIGNHSFAPGIGTPTGLSATPSSPASGSRTYRVSAIADETLEEGLSASVTISNYNTSGTCAVAWTAVSGAVLYNVYRSTGSTFGYIGTTDTNSFTDSNITPDVTLRPLVARTPFDSTDNYPSVVSFVEQRLALAATNNQPQLIEMSRTGAFTNFAVSYPSQGSDALRFRLRTRELNQIRGMVSGRALFVFTSSAEWVITGNDNEGILTPTSIVPKPESYFGSYDIEPLVVGEVAMFVTPDGNTIRDFLLSLNPQAQSQSRDLTIMVRELFENKEITSWCYLPSERTVWVTLSDGQLLSFCYMAEHEIWGWTRHVIGGTNPFVYQVIAAREGVHDRLYAVIAREVNGTDVVMTERLSLRADSNAFEPFFLDAGLTYKNIGTPAAALSGLLHLRGETVQALVNGDVVEDLVVDEAGVVALPEESDWAHVGLGYRCLIQTLPIDFETEGLGSMQGRFKAAGELAINLKRSRGVAAGQKLDELNELAEWLPGYVDGPIPPLTKQVNMTIAGDWMRDATIYLVQDYPLPMTILGVAPEWAPGG